MGSPFSHCAVSGAECLNSLYPRPLDGNLQSLAEPRRDPLWLTGRVTRAGAEQTAATVLATPSLRAFAFSVATSRALVGAWAKVSVLQFFIAEAVVIAAWAGPTPYSRRLNYISDLGALHCGVYAGRDVCSPLHLVMNVSFVLQGVAMIVGALFLNQAVFRVAAKLMLPAAAAHPLWTLVTRALIAVAGTGIGVVGVVPEDLNRPVHTVGAVMFFLAGGLSLVTAAWSWRHVSRVSAVLFGCGLVSLVSTAVFEFGGPGEPGTVERFMAYPITVGLAVLGLTMARGVRRARTILAQAHAR